MRQIDSFYQKLIHRAKYYISLLIRSLSRVRKGRILFWSTSFKNYSCNPKYLTDYILAEVCDQFEVFWAFKENANLCDVDLRVKQLRFGSIRYLFILNTAEFLITNHRTSPISIFWKKKKGQKYIMTWHGNMPLKKIQADTEQGKTSQSYIISNQNDSKVCDLMLSDSKWFTNTIKRAFWYNGDILEQGVPRNDMLFDVSKYSSAKQKVFNYYSLANDVKIVLYAPTFRTDHSINEYIFEWKDIKQTIEQKLGNNVVVLFRLHPTLLQKVDVELLKTDIQVIEATTYNDMQELLCASDMLITDYSSTMYEFSLIKKPCFLFVSDVNTYDRGFYCPLEDLPFAKAENIEQLIDNIRNCDLDQYINETHNFVLSFFNPLITSNASASVVKWMKQQMI